MQLTLICGRKGGRSKAILSGGSRLDVDVSIDWLGDSMIIDVRDAPTNGTAPDGRTSGRVGIKHASPHWSKRETDQEPVDMETFTQLRGLLTQADLGERLLIRGVTVGRILGGQTTHVDRKLNAAARELLDTLG